MAAMGENAFFFEKLGNLIRVPICVFRLDEWQLTEFGDNHLQQSVPEDVLGRLFREMTKSVDDFPRIYGYRKNCLLSIIPMLDAEAEYVLVGPVRIGDSNWNIRHSDKMFFPYIAKHVEVPVCRMDVFVGAIQLIHEQMNQVQMQEAELWDRNSIYFDSISRLQQRISEDAFAQHEQVKLHNPYEQELREQESIRNGDLEALERSVSESYEGEIGRLADDPLRQQKNVAIGNITLASRSAIQGGISAEQAFSMADSFIQQIEKMSNIVEVMAFNRETQREYTRLVAEHRKQTPQVGVGNPLVIAVKDYIYAHLHDNIQVRDIASQLHVNPDYLSHLFSTHEGVTIKQYLVEEKIRRSKNLLTYSDYKIKDIGFYLGFCSQSHFCKVFQKCEGMTPKEYRAKFGNENSWKTK